VCNRCHASGTRPLSPCTLLRRASCLDTMKATFRFVILHLHLHVSIVCCTSTLRTEAHVLLCAPQENVLSNVMRGGSVLELAGMAPRSEINHVMILRPLFGLTKTPVLDFAHKFGVPYFKDTTPLWSTRGKLRTQLVPLLKDIYGDGVRAPRLPQKMLSSQGVKRC